MKAAAKENGRRLLAPLARLFANLGVSPDHLTWAGATASGLAGALVGAGWFRTAALLLLVGALCDVLDGSVARATGKTSVFGAFLDSTVDRIAELFFFAGVLVYFVRVDDSAIFPLLTLLAAGGSFLVSYTRARAEGLGISCAVGMMERPERLVLLLVATLVGPIGLRAAMAVLTPLVFWTSFQRMLHVYRETRV
jgi:CDP-diacylglycerol--glycerol-3-phosphate 3-phosphatidyltransferase